MDSVNQRRQQIEMMRIRRLHAQEQRSPPSGPLKRRPSARNASCACGRRRNSAAAASPCANGAKPHQSPTAAASDGGGFAIGGVHDGRNRAPPDRATSRRASGAQQARSTVNAPTAAGQRRVPASGNVERRRQNTPSTSSRKAQTPPLRRAKAYQRRNRNIPNKVRASAKPSFGANPRACANRRAQAPASQREAVGEPQRER